MCAKQVNHVRTYNIMILCSYIATYIVMLVCIYVHTYVTRFAKRGLIHAITNI